jgi:FkbM family methyltransferase
MANALPSAPALKMDQWGYYRPTLPAALCITALRQRVARGAIKGPVRKLLARLGSQYDVEVDGLKLRCRVNDNYTEQMALERNGHTNRIAIDMITADLKPGGVFVDVGANCGLFVVFAARKVGPSGRVIAIEPLPAMLARLRFNIAANCFTNVTVCPTAVGAQRGKATIHVSPRQYGHASLVATDGEELTVPVTPLQAIVESAGVRRIDALKIDIEGFEDRALLPFIRFAPRHLWPARIFMEVDHASRWQEDCLGGLLEVGYREHWRSGSDILLALPPAAC